MTEKLLKSTAIYSGIFFVIAMCAVLYFGMNKTIEISNLSQDEVVINEESIEVSVKKSDDVIMFSQEKVNTEYLCIPLPENVKPDSIVIENHYMDGELRILVADADSSFYKDHELSGNHMYITAGRFEQKGKNCQLSFEVKDIFEYRTIFENNELYVSFLKPKEMFEKIVVIDPVYGGSESGAIANEIIEKSIALDVAKSLKSMLDDSGIKAYYTRMDDVNPKEDVRVRLANNTKADMYLRIGVSNNQDESVYGISCEYNDEYFIPGFGSVELSDVMAKEIAIEAKGKAIGLFKAPIGSIAMRDATVPATTIRIGCISNKQEALLLSREDYIKKIAQGIYNGIMKAYESMEN